MQIKKEPFMIILLESILFQLNFVYLKMVQMAINLLAEAKVIFFKHEFMIQYFL